MKHFKTIYLKLIMLLVTVSLTAQQRLSKIDQSVRADKDVMVELSSSHTNIELETWNKDYIEVEAYMESKTLSKAELQDALDAWDVSLSGDSDNVKITSKGSRGIWSEDMSLTILDEESIQALANLPELLELNLEPLLEELGNLDALKELPEQFKLLNIPRSPDGNYNIDFDYEKYKEEGEPYLDAWSKKYHKEYGSAYEKEMREWAKSIKQEDIDKFEKDIEKWAENFGEEIESLFGDDFEKSMEEWGENLGKKMEEAFGDDFEDRMEKWGEELGKKIEQSLENAFDKDGKKKNKKLFDDVEYNTTKTIIIRMPKKAKLQLNVKHGELKMASVMHNAKADITHGSLLAQSIDGSSTSINVKYSSVFIKEWKAGELNLKYVDEAMIQNVEELMLNAVSSTISLDYIKGNTIIDGSFGELIIHKLVPNFNNLNIVLENSDAMLKLPKDVDYTLFFKGNRSKLNNETATNKKIDYFNGKSNSTNTIVINAKYSNVVAE